MSLTLEDVVKFYLVILTSYTANLKRAKPLLVPTPKKLKSARNCAAFAFFFLSPSLLCRFGDREQEIPLGEIPLLLRIEIGYRLIDGSLAL